MVSSLPCGICFTCYARGVQRAGKRKLYTPGKVILLYFLHNLPDKRNGIVHFDILRLDVNCLVTF